jgi:signal transduction histidine kinase/NO-binding membrane sensor protein with MHYT domain
MGGGIWAMHFVAMLAFSLPVMVSYDVGLTTLSLALPIGVTALSFLLVSRPDVGFARLVAAGTMMGLAVAAMHYTGMAAMRMAADLSYAKSWVAASICIAIGASLAALWLSFRAAGRIYKIGAAAIMGVAISGMHYAAMQAATFTAHPASDEIRTQPALGQSNLALAVALTTCLILGLALIASFHERQERAEAAGGGLAPSLQHERTSSYFGLLVTASVLVPLAVFALAAWQNWQHLEIAAEDSARKRVNLVAEHALKVLQNNEQVLRRVEGELFGRSLEEIRRTYAVNSYLNKLVEDIDHLDGVGFVGPDGRLVAISQAFPAPPVDLSAADFVRNAADATRRSHVSTPTRAVFRNRTVFRLSQQWSNAEAEPPGVVFAAMSLDYFVQFYRSITDGEDSVTMARADGTVLVRDPPVTTGVLTMSPQSGLMRGIAQSDRGIYRTISELDQVSRIHAYQRVGSYPIFVSYGLSLTAVAREWRVNLLVFGVVAVVSALALSTLSLFALRRANQEHRIFARWQAESERRKVAEEALRQAQKMEAVGQLTGGIAHDFNNLLTVVVGNLDIAERALANANIPKAQRNIASAFLGAQRAASLTHRLLAFSRRQPLQPQVVDLNALVAGMSDLFKRTLGESIQVETILAENLWNTRADPNQLESALLNLVINARDAMPEGGRLTIRTANSTLDENYAAAHAEVVPGDYVLVSVSDTGSGMAPGVLERAFEPFFTTKDIGQGTGLGLSMIYGFVRQSGGHVKIESAPGRGTDVKIYLARTLARAAPQATGAQPAPRATSGETVLVVEDDANVRAYSTESLRSLGYRVVEAQDAPTALKQLDAHPDIRLLFTDVGLPGLNGRELAEEARLRRPGLPVLFTSGYTHDAVIMSGAQGEGLPLLTKPFTVEQLASRIRQAIECSHARV